MDYRADLLDKIAQENVEAEQRIQTIQQPVKDRFADKLNALWGKGVPFQLLNIKVELKFTMRSWAFLETEGIHELKENDEYDAKKKVLLFAIASTLHDNRVDWAKLIQNGYIIDVDFQKACLEAWEISKPVPPTCPPDEISTRIMSKKPTPDGFGIDYMGMLVSLGKQFGWTKEEFWAMSPREIGLILDEYNWDVHYQNLIEKEYMKKNR